MKLPLPQKLNKSVIGQWGFVADADAADATDADESAVENLRALRGF